LYIDDNGKLKYTIYYLLLNRRVCRNINGGGGGPNPKPHLGYALGCEKGIFNFWEWYVWFTIASIASDTEWTLRTPIKLYGTIVRPTETEIDLFDYVSLWITYFVPIRLLSTMRVTVRQTCSYIIYIPLLCTQDKHKNVVLNRLILTRLSGRFQFNHCKQTRHSGSFLVCEDQNI
jgi:hypothetical protein